MKDKPNKIIYTVPEFNFSNFSKISFSNKRHIKLAKRYDIWMRCYPQADENMSEEWELDPMTLMEAKRFCEDAEKRYADEGWEGHPLYKAKFYFEERR